MAVQSMVGCGGITLQRCLSIFLILCIILLTRDFWLPSTPIEEWHVPAFKTDAPSSDHSSIDEQSALHELDVDRSPSGGDRPTLSALTDMPAPASALTAANDDFCSSAPDAHKVMIIMKTGGNSSAEQPVLVRLRLTLSSL